jgi:Zn-finger nucleic acid-binding protein
MDEQGFREARDHVDPEHAWLHFDLWKNHESFAVEGKRRACPSCGQPLFALTYADTPVVIDHCHECGGVWLDEKELENVVAALETEVADMPASELFAAALREAGEIAKSPSSLAREWPHTVQILKLLGLRVLTDNPRLRRIILEFQKATPFN